ncbi:MAG: hypothetical protein M3137_18615, partial [Actinomycetota bacterium]|nr:hypothetical protein [Actinomycetota bacterium]
LRAEGLGGGNQQLLAASLLADQLPELVARSAEALEGSNLVVLNGTEGVSQVLSGVAGQGMAILDVLRQGLGLPRTQGPGSDRYQNEGDAPPAAASLSRGDTGGDINGAA